MGATTLDAETKEAMVRSAPDVGALKRVLAIIGSVPGSRGRIYTAAELIEQVDAAVQAPALASHVTRGLGLREKVRELSGLAARCPSDAEPRTGSRAIAAPHATT
ncbi:MAG: hypothetical protein AB1689_11265 [Thermodesulfobacteriota bacterium]